VRPIPERVHLFDQETGVRLEGAGGLMVHAAPLASAESDVIPSNTRDHSGERRSRRLLSRAGELIKRGDGYEPAAHYMRGPGPKTLARSREAGQLPSSN
jgi:hypothetical protein